MIDLTAAGANTVAALVRDRQISAVELIKSALDRIARLNPVLNAFISVGGADALRAAEQVDRDVAAGQDLPLAGVPLAVKDSFDAKGFPTTAGSKALGGVAARDATAVARLKAAGCVVVGKAAMHEFAFGFTSRNPHFGDCKNPWDVARIPGGSSGGNAAALAASLALAALGGDTGGSIRMPAALCGVVGLKVTYGRVSRFGGVPLSWSMDTVGPMARTVADAAALLQAIAGHDPLDPATSRMAVPRYLDGLKEGDLQGVRLGVPHNHFFEVLDPDVATVTHDALETLKGLGATLIDVQFPPVDLARAAHRTIIFSEAAAAHDEMVRARGNVLDPEIRRLLQAGHFLGAPQYLAAQQARQEVVGQYRTLWKTLDVLATPTCPIPATTIGATTARLGGVDRDLVNVYLDHTLPFNLTGQPALSVPCGFTKRGLPVGLQLVGRPFDEKLLLRTAAVYEAATTWHDKRPNIDAPKRN